MGKFPSLTGVALLSFLCASFNAPNHVKVHLPRCVASAHVLGSKENTIRAWMLNPWWLEVPWSPLLWWCSQCGNLCTRARRLSGAAIWDLISLIKKLDSWICLKGVCIDEWLKINTFSRFITNNSCLGYQPLRRGFKFYQTMSIKCKTKIQF